MVTFERACSSVPSLFSSSFNHEKRCRATTRKEDYPHSTRLRWPYPTGLAHRSTGKCPALINYLIPSSYRLFWPCLPPPTGSTTRAWPKFTRRTSKTLRVKRPLLSWTNIGGIGRPRTDEKTKTKKNEPHVIFPTTHTQTHTDTPKHTKSHQITQKTHTFFFTAIETNCSK